MSENLNLSKWHETAVGELMEYGVIDAHHHMLGRSQRRESDPGVWEWLLATYLMRGALRTADFKAEDLLNENILLSRKIDLLLPLLRLMRTTTYYRVAREALLGAFGFDLNDLDISNVRALDETIRQANVREDWFDEILSRRMNLKGGILDMHVGGTQTDATLGGGGASDWYDYILRVRPTRSAKEIDALTRKRTLDGQSDTASVKIDALIYGHPKCIREELKDLFGGNPEEAQDLDGYLEYTDGVFEQINADPRLRALKSSQAGMRSLFFPQTDRERAERVFSRNPGKLTRQEVADFENFMMHHICRRAGEYNLPIQFHTGTPFAGFNDDRSCSPSLLTNLFVIYPETRFDLMHGGYPYYGECGTLAARFRNVYLNLSFTTLMSDTDARHALSCWLDQVPADKIMWGGDCFFIEETYGTYLVSRRQIIDVLWERIMDGCIGTDDALMILRRIFCDNARELFNL